MTSHARPFATCLVAFLTLSAPAYAYDWSVTASPTVIEGTYMPDKFNFQITSNAGACTAGSWLNWYAKGVDAPTKAANIAAVLSMVMTAKSTNRSLTLFGDNTGCIVQFIWLN